MYEIDYLPVGEEGQSGDAIALRFTHPETQQYAHVIVDAGFQSDGDALVEHVQRWYGTRTIDVAIVTHPDGDHIGGMGKVVRELDVGVLCIHRLGQRGGGSLPAADAVDELIAVAQDHGTAVHEPFAGHYALGGALTFLGPDEDYYAQLVRAQVAGEQGRATGRSSSAFGQRIRTAGQRFLAALPIEVPFDDDGGTNPRNNSSIITMVTVGAYRALLAGDAGVPALERAWDWLENNGRDSTSPNFMHVPHAGSRHNASSAMLNRLLGEPGQERARTAQVSVASRSTKHPSPRVANAYMRRGCRVFETRGNTIHHHSADAPDRGWGPATPLEPMAEPEDD